MKKIITCCLALVLAVSFTACAQSGTPSSSSESSGSSSEASATEVPEATDAPEESDPAAERAARVLEQLYTNPDETLVALLPRLTYALELTDEKPDEAQAADGEAALEELNAHFAEKFDAADFTANYFTLFCTQLTDDFSFVVDAAMANAVVTVENVTVTSLTEVGSVYTYAVEMTVEVNGATQSVTETGRVQLNGDGLVSSIYDMDGALSAVITA